MHLKEEEERLRKEEEERKEEAFRLQREEEDERQRRAKRTGRKTPTIQSDEMKGKRNSVCCSCCRCQINILGHH